MKKIKVRSSQSVILLVYPCHGINLEPLHMNPVTGLARLPGRILLSVHMGNFSPVAGTAQHFCDWGG